jgi:sugar/nucleoside kinase (ribokinase family)
LKEVIARVDILTINDAEARQLSGEHSLVKAANKILAMGPKYLVVKKGEHGALLFGAGRVFFAPALPLEDVMIPPALATRSPVASSATWPARRTTASTT